MRLRTVFLDVMAILSLCSAGLSCDRNASSAPPEIPGAASAKEASDDTNAQQPAESGSEQSAQSEQTVQLRRAYGELGSMYEQMAREHSEDQSMQWGSMAMHQMQRQMGQMEQNCCGQMMMEHGRHGMMDRDQPGRMGRGRHGMKDRDHRGMMRDRRRQRMRGRWMMGGPAMAQWHQQMARQHIQRAQKLEQADEDQQAQMHRQTAGKHQQMAKMMGQMMGQVPDDQAVAEQNGETDEKPEGDEIFAANCASCHGAQGEGVSGAFPPLTGNPVVTGSKQRLIRIVQEGLTGPLAVGGQTYFGVMPGFQSQLSSAELATVLTHIRSKWKNDAGTVTVEDVNQATVEGRDRPWTTRELGLAPSE